MSENTTLAKSVATLVGGPDNVSWLGSCTTRLRFHVRDESQVDFDALNRTPGVLKAITAGGQVQIVIGTHVEQVRDEVYKLSGWKSFKDGEAASSTGGDGDGKKRSALDAVFDFLGGTFQPLLAPITGAAMIQVIALLLSQYGGMDVTSPTYLILNATGNALFYFLPVFVAFTASRKLGVNPFVGATIAAALLHPSFVAMGTAGEVVQAFGLPLFVYSYASSMFPALMLALALAGLDRVLKRVIPNMLQQIFVPTLELLLLVPLTALVFGPIGVIVGNGIASGTSWLSDTSPFAFYLILPAAWVFLVSMGLHWALLPIVIGELAATGQTAVFGAAMGYQYAMVGIALGVLIKVRKGQKDKALRDVASAATIAAFVGGVTEPTLYGLVLRYRRLIVIEVIGAAASGVVLGIVQQTVGGIAVAPIFGLPLMSSIPGAIIALVVAVVVPVVLIQVWGFEKKTAPLEDADGQRLNQNGSAAAGFLGVTDSAAPSGELDLAAPLAGTIVPLEQTGDPVFAGGLIGPGVSIKPSSNRIVAPADAIVVSAPASAHAIGLRTDNGVEVLVHIGIDTVQLAGKHFSLKVRQGQRVTRGETLLEFDREAIIAAGYSIVTPVVVTNLATGQEVTVSASGDVLEGEPLLTVHHQTVSAPRP